MNRHTHFAPIPGTPFFVQVLQSCYNWKDEINPKEGELQLHAKSTHKTNNEWCIDGGSLYGIARLYCIRSHF